MKPKTLAWITLCMAAGIASAQTELPEPSWDHLPRWRGFNLLEKFNVGRNEPFKEIGRAHV